MTHSEDFLDLGQQRNTSNATYRTLTQRRGWGKDASQRLTQR
jgi:hypothetical protein